MKEVKKIDLILIAIYAISFFLLHYSLKFFFSIVNTKLYNYLLFVSSNKYLNEELQRKIISDYPLLWYQLFVFGLSSFFVLSIFSFFLFKKYNKIRYNFIILLFVLAFVEYFNISEFMRLGYYNLMPTSFFNNLKIYLVANGVGYVFLSLLLFFIFIRKRFKNEPVTTK